MCRHYPELRYLIKLMEVRLEFQGLLEVLQELTLECDDFLDVSEQRCNLGVR